MTQTDPYAQFAAWFAEAEKTEVNDPNAMTLATATPAGLPSARIVLLKGWDAEGFIFYTNRTSQKGAELAANPHAFLLFHWKSLRRQVRIAGPVEQVSDAESDEYYQSRPRGSRLGAWASLQSSTLPARDDLLRRVAALEAQYPGETPIPRPPHWGGYRVRPTEFEFWQDMPFRLHDRSVHTRTKSGWAVSKLFP